MRNPFTILTKLVQKAIALVVLAALTAFSFIFNALFFIYRLVAVFLACAFTVAVLVNWYSHGVNLEGVLILLGSALAVALRYLLPLLVPFIQHWQSELVDFVFAPLFIRPPVRYTI